MTDLSKEIMVQVLVLGFTKAAATVVQAGADSLVVEKALLQAGLVFSQFQGDPILIARAAHVGE